jgi:CheY-like chemotaxis protein
LVKRLVELHAGSIEARSEGLGKGSEFIVRIPLAGESAPRVEVATEPEMDELALRILVVDDNRDGAESLSMLLKVLGSQTVTAYDGEEAVAVAERYRPDVILLDIGLPKLNGYEACRRIRKQEAGRETIIIAQTGWGQNEDRERTREAGFDHHLVKPVDPNELMKLLHSITKKQ